MMRLIDADALMVAMYRRAFETDNDTLWMSGCWVRYKAIEQVIREQPTAVHHATWLEDGGELKCSECNSIFFNDIMDMNKDEMPSFCPVCGARMDGE